MVYARLGVWLVLTGGLLVAVIFTAGCASTGEGEKDRPKDKPVLTITEAPDEMLKPGPASWGAIGGTVSGIKPEDHRVVIYALGDVWYVQPLASGPFTKIGKDGKWKSDTHGGYEYAAFLVKPSYRPAAETRALPDVAGDVQAMDRVKPAKPGDKNPQR